MNLLDPSTDREFWKLQLIRGCCVAVAWCVTIAGFYQPALRFEPRGPERVVTFYTGELYASAVIDMFMLKPRGFELFGALAAMMLTPVSILFPRRARRGRPLLAWTSWGLLLIWIPPVVDLLSYKHSTYLQGYYMLAGAFMLAFIAIDRRRVVAARPSSVYSALVQ